VAAGGWIFFAADDGPHGRELFVVPAASLDARCAVPPSLDPPPPAGDWLVSPELPGFRFKVLFGEGAGAQLGSLAPCVTGTLCVVAAPGDHRELLVRLVAHAGSPITAEIAKLTPVAAQVWIEQVATTTRRYYRLEPTAADDDTLDGVRDRAGFAASAGTTFGNPRSDDARAAGGPWLTPRGMPGFRLRLRWIDGAGRSQPVRAEACMSGALCLSTSVRGRSDLFVRLLDQGQLGLWPAFARLSTGGAELWIQHTSTGVLRHYVLPPVPADSDELDGLLDRQGFH
jgi:hypothetical protein